MKMSILLFLLAALLTPQLKAQQFNFDGYCMNPLEELFGQQLGANQKRIFNYTMKVDNLFLYVGTVSSNKIRTRIFVDGIEHKNSPWVLPMLKGQRPLASQDRLIPNVKNNKIKIEITNLSQTHSLSFGYMAIGITKDLIINSNDAAGKIDGGLSKTIYTVDFDSYLDADITIIKKGGAGKLTYRIEQQREFQNREGGTFLRWVPTSTENPIYRGTIKKSNLPLDFTHDRLDGPIRLIVSGESGSVDYKVQIRVKTN